MLYISDDNQVDIIDAFNTTSRYLDDILNINMFLIRLSFGSKDCTEEWKLECASFLGQTS